MLVALLSLLVGACIAQPYHPGEPGHYKGPYAYPQPAPYERPTVYKPRNPYATRDRAPYETSIWSKSRPVTPWAKRPAKGYDTPKTDDPYWEPSPYVQQTTYKPRTKGYYPPKTVDPYWEPSPYVQQTTYKPRTKGYYPRTPYQELPPYFPQKATGYTTEYDGLYDPPRNKPVFRSPKRSGRYYWRSRRGRRRNRG